MGASDPVERWFSEGDRRETFYGHNDRFQNRAVAWELEMLPDRGPCYMCQDLYGRDLFQHAGLPSFALRSKDGTLSLGTCGYHLETTAIMWDTLHSEIATRRQGMP